MGKTQNFEMEKLAHGHIAIEKLLHKLNDECSLIMGLQSEGYNPSLPLVHGSTHVLLNLVEYVLILSHQPNVRGLIGAHFEALSLANIR